VAEVYDARADVPIWVSSERYSMRSLKSFRGAQIAIVGALLFFAGARRGFARGQEMAPGPQQPNAQAAPSQAPEPDAAASPSAAIESSAPQSAPAVYDPAIFQKPLSGDQLTFLNDLVGQTANDAMQNKLYVKLLHGVIPDCMFHYGDDMPLFDAMKTVLSGSSDAVQFRDSRYVIVSGHNGPYLGGRGMMWIDLQSGIVLGAFYFHPTNGEPTPAVNVFSKQVKEKSLEMSQLPAAFAEDLNEWYVNNRISLVTTRYFITGGNEKIVLEHDEDYCSPAYSDVAPADEDCGQMNADASDDDMNAAIYVEQTNHATNATAWMIVDDEQKVWIETRDSTCNIDRDPLECHIRMTRDRTRVILHRAPGPPARHPHS